MTWTYQRYTNLLRVYEDYEQRQLYNNMPRQRVISLLYTITLKQRMHIQYIHVACGQRYQRIKGRKRIGIDRHLASCLKLKQPTGYPRYIPENENTTPEIAGPFLIVSMSTPEQMSTPPVWRFEPSPASEAIWANDLLVETIYRHAWDTRSLDKEPTIINGMLLCKSRFWMIAKIRFEKCWYKELTDALQAGCSLDRFNGYSGCVRTLLVRETAYPDDEPEEAVPPRMHRHKQDLAYLRKHRGQLPNLKAIKVLPDPDYEPCNVQRLVECDGTSIHVDYAIHSYIPRHWECRHGIEAEPGCCDKLLGITIGGYEDDVESEEAIMEELMEVLNTQTMVVGSVTSTVHLGHLRVLSFLPFDHQGDGRIHLDMMSSIFDSCPELQVLRCRLRGSAAYNADEVDLDCVFSKGKMLHTIHLETEGALVPYLSALSRFRDVELTCRIPLPSDDLARLNDPSGRRLPFEARTERFEMGFHPAYFSVHPRAKMLDVIQIIETLLPANCEISYDKHDLRSFPIDATDLMRAGWRHLVAALYLLQEDRSKSRPLPRTFVPMTPGELAKALQSKDERLPLSGSSNGIWVAGLPGQGDRTDQSFYVDNESNERVEGESERSWFRERGFLVQRKCSHDRSRTAYLTPEDAEEIRIGVTNLCADACSIIASMIHLAVPNNP
ncbi:hypothetical protein FFLO_03900 [Filobasidium floriforme]|uniref:Uncharacterized protein n=1 Tax=Filobasidium floriforme TaxID=5210 RepID=A0A8K0NMT5_9TREE|nr:uncharacterized protein HD553DRAFT_323774 [Filobasidium floriforme]KAG7532025.1 hypothetical protein FFLO_03900 [Filobasidium floriforme]KAH8085197.1 hypothetical protein HD553DRAFT_323774 [Filobasidium floriforme]